MKSIVEEQKLGTNKVREVFGEIKPEVIYQDGEKRIMVAKSIDDRVGSYSIVHFNEFGKKFMPNIHQEILKGNFIGETFSRHGVPVYREEDCAFLYSTPPALQKIFGRSEKESLCKRVVFRIGHVRVPYATIIEIYSPVIGFDSLFEHTENSSRETVKELDCSFSTVNNYFIQPLNPAEIEKYLSLAHEFLRKPMHVGIENKQEFVKKTLETALDLMRDPNTVLIVAQKNDDFIGYLSANIHPALHLNGHECMIREVYVKEDFRRKGIASSLIRTIEKVAIKRGSKRVSLATNMNDEMQNSFYSSLRYLRRCDFNVKYLTV